MDFKGNILDMAKLVPIPPEREAEVRGMNRKQRRTWFAQQRALIKKGKARRHENVLDGERDGNGP